MASLITSVSVMVILMIVWSAVQRLWKRAFPEEVINDDALAGRDCGHCTCSGPCSNRKKEQHKHMNS